MKDIKDADITSNGELFIVTTAGELQHIFITDVQNGAKPVLVSNFRGYRVYKLWKSTYLCIGYGRNIIYKRKK